MHLFIDFRKDRSMCIRINPIFGLAYERRDVLLGIQINLIECSV